MVTVAVGGVVALGASVWVWVAVLVGAVVGAALGVHVTVAVGVHVAVAVCVAVRLAVTVSVAVCVGVRLGVLVGGGGAAFPVRLIRSAVAPTTSALPSPAMIKGERPAPGGAPKRTTIAVMLSFPPRLIANLMNF